MGNTVCFVQVNEQNGVNKKDKNVEKRKSICCKVFKVKGNVLFTLGKMCSIMQQVFHINT